MFKSNYKGYGSGIISAMAWGLDTVCDLYDRT